MSLKAELEAIKAHSATRIPPAAQALMRQATDELRASGVAARSAPEFPLPNTCHYRKIDLCDRSHKIGYLGGARLSG